MLTYIVSKLFAHRNNNKQNYIKYISKSKLMQISLFRHFFFVNPFNIRLHRHMIFLLATCCIEILDRVVFLLDTCCLRAGMSGNEMRKNSSAFLIKHVRYQYSFACIFFYEFKQKCISFVN